MYIISDLTDGPLDSGGEGWAILRDKNPVTRIAQVMVMIHISFKMHFFFDYK